MFRLGLNAKLYYNTDGIGGGGAWEELTKARDVTLTGEHNEADASNRSSEWELAVATLKKGAIEFELLWDPDDPGCAAIIEAWSNKDVIGIRCLDEANGQGLEADTQVFKFERSEPLNGVQMFSCSVKPTYSDNPPQWLEGS